MFWSHEIPTFVSLQKKKFSENFVWIFSTFWVQSPRCWRIHTCKFYISARGSGNKNLGVVNCMLRNAQHRVAWAIQWQKNWSQVYTKICVDFKVQSTIHSTMCGLPMCQYFVNLTLLFMAFRRRVHSETFTLDVPPAIMILLAQLHCRICV